AIVDEIEEFLTGERHVREPDRILATILFTDIVGSTDRAAAMGDQRWRDLLQSFYVRVRGEFRQYRGIEVGTAGGGGPARFEGRGTHTLKGVPGEWPLFAAVAQGAA